jgi:hypothetical protein
MTNQQILRQRMHGLYLSRKCDDIVELSRELLGLHSWFHRNVAFSALIRGADIMGWRNALTKTWVHHALHGVARDELPTLLALHPFGSYLSHILGEEQLSEIAERVLYYMEDGVYSRREFREIFAEYYSPEIIDHVFSSWGGIFVYLARQGRVAFRSMVSHDFDLIDAAPTRTPEEVMPELLHRYMTVYGPATLDDAAWFLGLQREEKKKLKSLDMSEFEQFKLDGRTYYHLDPGDTADIPELTLLAGFDPLIVSYMERGAVLPPEYKKRVVMSSGICLPTVAVNGKVAGLWNITKGEPTVEFFEPQAQGLRDAAFDMVEVMRWKTAGMI